MSTLASFQTELTALAEPLVAATVSIGRDHRASGFVVAPNLVVTNAHALRDRTVLVTFPDGRAVQGEVRAADGDGDLAVIAVDTGNITPLMWSEVAPAPGNVVVSGHGRSGIAVGFVGVRTSSFRGPKGRIVADAFEHGTAINRGASGGPVVDINGRLVGINTARTHAGYRAVVASSAVRSRIEALSNGESVERPTLGIAIVEPAAAARVRSAAGLAPRDGVLISAVGDGSPAATAGLSQGDLIVAIDGRAISSVDDVHRALDTGTTEVSVVAVRGETERTVTVSFAPKAA
jgi:S1-C subfamily serine protease